MGYLLLWLFALGACVSWLAAALATPTRDSGLIARIVLRLFIASPAFGCAGVLICQVYVMRGQGYIHAGDAWLIYILMGLLAPITVIFLCQRWWKRPSNPHEVEQKAMRRRTVAAVYGLAALCAAMHVFTAWVLAGAAVDVVETQLAAPRATVEAYLDADKARWEPVLAQRGADQPRDFVSAYKAYENDPDPQVKARREAISAWLQCWYAPIFQQGQPVMTYKTRIVDYMKTNSAEDTIEETLPETLRRFAPEVAALRQLTAIRPYKADATLKSMSDWNSEDPLMTLQGMANNLKVDAVGSLALGDWRRAAQDLAAIENLSELAFDKGMMIGGLVGIACRAIGQPPAETYLSAPGLTAEDLGALSIGGHNTCQQRFARLFDFEIWFVIQGTREAAHGRISPYDSLAGFPWDGYPGWLVRGYLPPTAAEDVARVADELRLRVTQPYHQNLAVWQAQSDRARDGYEGSNLWEMTGSILSACVSADMRDDLLQVGRAAQLYRLKHGRFPAALTALAPEFLPALPVDRFTGQALLFRVEDDGQGLVIWSVGSDGEDNGATLEEECEHNDTDIALFLGESYRRAEALAQKNRQDRTANN